MCIQMKVLDQAKNDTTQMILNNNRNKTVEINTSKIAKLNHKC
jgi:hypothetical protein